MSSPGQGNSETRRLLTLRRSFYRFRISYDERNPADAAPSKSRATHGLLTQSNHQQVGIHDQLSPEKIALRQLLSVPNLIRDNPTDALPPPTPAVALTVVQEDKLGRLWWKKVVYFQALPELA